MPLLRTEEHEGLVCKFYDGVVVMVGTTAADRFTIRLKDGDEFPTRLKEKLKERCAATKPEHKAHELYRKRPTADEELKTISAKNQKIDAERRAAKQPFQPSRPTKIDMPSATTVQASNRCQNHSPSTQQL